MAFFRSRVKMALIGLIVVGAVSAALAVSMSAQPAQLAVSGVGQKDNATITVGMGTPSATAASGQTTAPTATTKPTATSKPSPPSGQLVDLHGVVSSVDTNAGVFYVRRNDSTVTVIVTNTTTYQGAAHSLSDLTPGMLVKVKSSPQADGSYSAVDVNANTDN